MAFPLLTFSPLSPSSKPRLPLFKSQTPLPTLHINLIQRITLPTTVPTAIGPDGKYYPTPLHNSIGPDGKYYHILSDDEPPEAPEDTQHGVSTFEKIKRDAARARKEEEEQFKKDQSTFLKAIEDVEDAPDNPDDETLGDDLFEEIDRAIALKRKEFVKQGLLPPNPKKDARFLDPSVEGIEELTPEEVVDLDEICELEARRVVSEEEPIEDDHN